MSLPSEAEEEVVFSNPPAFSWNRQRPNPLQLQVYNLLDDSFTGNEEAELDQ